MKNKQCSVGDRIIYKGTSFFSDWIEAEVLEYSPDMQQLKLKLHRSDGTEYITWKDVDDIGEIKILPRPSRKEGKNEPLGR